MVTTRRMAKQVAENGGAPLESQKLEGIYVTFTGIEKNLQKNLSQVVSRSGGIVQKFITKLTTLLIAHKMTDEKCFEASKNQIPVVKSDYIFAVRDAPGDVDVRNADFISTYSLKTFENVLVCVSKCPKEVHVKIQNAIVAGGGNYSRNLQKNKTDVVIIPAAIGDKFKVARQWKIPTVTPAWVLKSAAEDQLLPLTEFQPPLQPLQSTQIPGASVQGPTFSGISTIVPPATSAANIHSSHLSVQFHSLSALIESTTQADDTCSIHMKTTDVSRILFVGLVFIVHLESEGESRRISELIKTNGGDILLDIGQVEHGTIAILPPLYSGRLAKGILESFTKYWVEDVCMQKCLVDFELSLHHKTIQVDENSGKLLSGFSVFITGYSEPITNYLGVLATHLGANIQKSLNVKSKPGRQRINYVISNDMDDKSVEIGRSSGIPIVTKGWLVACCEQNAILDHGNFLLSSENTPSVDESSSTSVATPEGSRGKRKSSPLQDASTWVNYSKFGTIIPGTPESSKSLFSTIHMRDYQHHGDSGTCHHSCTSADQSDSPDDQHGSPAKRLKKLRDATSSSGTSSATSGYTSSKSAERSS